MPGFMAPANRPPTGGIYEASGDGRFVYRMSGFVHGESVSTFARDEAESYSYTDVSLRRARAAVEATMFGVLDARLLWDFTMDVIPLDAYVELRLNPAANLRVGKFKSPFGFERLAPVYAVQFTERAYPTQLGPNRDFGVFLHGRSAARTVGYEVAFLGGAEDLEIQHFYDGSPSFAGRVYVMPFRGGGGPETLRDLGFGASTTAGESDESQGIQVRWSVHGHYQLARLGVWLEYVEKREGLGAAAITPRTDRAYLLQTSVMLTDDDNDFFGLKPRRPFAPKKGQWGAVALATRFHELRQDDRTPITEPSPQSRTLAARAGGMALLWKLDRLVEARLDLEYARRRTLEVSSEARSEELALRARLEARF